MYVAIIKRQIKRKELEEKNFQKIDKSWIFRAKEGSVVFSNNRLTIISYTMQFINYVSNMLGIKKFTVITLTEKINDSKNTLNFNKVYEFEYYSK